MVAGKKVLFVKKPGGDPGIRGAVCLSLAPDQPLAFSSSVTKRPSKAFVGWREKKKEKKTPQDVVNESQQGDATAASHVTVAHLLLQGMRHKPGVEAAGSPDSARGRGENKAIK